MKFFIDGNESKAFGMQEVVTTKGANKGRTTRILGLPKGLRVRETHSWFTSGIDTEFRIGESLETSVVIPMSPAEDGRGRKKVTGRIPVVVDDVTKIATVGLVQNKDLSWSPSVSVSAPGASNLIDDDEL